MKRPFAFFILTILLSACSSATQASSEITIIHVYAPPSVQPWMSKLYDCTPASSVIGLSDSSSTADVRLHLGEPKNLGAPAYQFDEEEMVVAVNRQSSMNEMTLEEVQNLFGQGNASVQVWGYASDEDMQVAFDQLVMKGRSVTSLAKLVVSPSQMADVLDSDPNAVGILSQKWMRNSLKSIFSFGPVPVLAITNQEPQGVVKDLISCLQK